MQPEEARIAIDPPSTAGETFAPTVAEGPEDILKPKLQLNFEVPCSSCAYLTDDSLAALGMENGEVNIIASNKGSVQYVLKSTDKSPVSSITLNPDRQNLKNAILLTHIDGTLEYWHTTSRQLLFQKKYDQFLYACEINPDGTKYVFAGDKGHLMISNLNKSTPNDLQEGHIGAHTNRVFCIKWNKQDPNCFISAGWDKTVFFWDVRSKTATDKLFGYYMGGKAIDIHENNVLLGSNSKDFPLRLYDTKTRKMRAIDWHHYDQGSLNATTGILSCCFSFQEDKRILAQSARNQLRVFGEGRCEAIYRQQHNVKAYSMSHAGESKEVITSWSNGDIKIIKY